MNKEESNDAKEGREIGEHQKAIWDSRNSLDKFISGGIKQDTSDWSDAKKEEYEKALKGKNNE